VAISSELIAFLRKMFRLELDGIHGAAHWSRVRDNGVRLATETGASVQVVEYFSFLHDSCRRNDGRDPEHGPRAAHLAKAIRARYIALDNAEFELLLQALEGHTHGTKSAEITVATCWDADRLDLGRVDIVPDPRYLLTDVGRQPDFIDWAWRRSVLWRENYLVRKRKDTHSGA
jgi:uncharacterized protein